MDPYKVLGVSSSDSDETIKKAYKELVKKYHPDRHNNSPLNELAEEKTAEINAAFDEIMNMRRGGTSSNGGVDYYDIRQKIQHGNITEAERVLDAVSPSFRIAEWFFLKGSICYKRGWLNDAYDNMEKATRMEPSNSEYNAALNQLKMHRNGNMNGNPYNNPYRTNNNGAGCDGCTMCQGLICADCCCECMGGDLIGCC